MDWWGVEEEAALMPLTDECAERGGRLALLLLPAWLIGWVRLVDKLRISLPCTTMLSFDFLRSRVSISGDDALVSCPNVCCVKYYRLRQRQDQ